MAKSTTAVTPLHSSYCSLALSRRCMIGLVPLKQSWSTLQWGHNDPNGVANHRRFDCLLSRFFRRRSENSSKPRVNGLCGGHPPVTGGVPSQRVSNVENVSIWWRHHGIGKCIIQISTNITTTKQSTANHAHTSWEILQSPEITDTKQTHDAIITSL